MVASALLDDPTLLGDLRPLEALPPDGTGSGVDMRIAHPSAKRGRGADEWDPEAWLVSARRQAEYALALAKTHNSVVAWARAAQIYMTVEEDLKALDAARQAITLGAPRESTIDEEPALHVAISVLSHFGQMDEALARLSAMPNSAVAKALSVDILVAADRLDEALDVLVTQTGHEHDALRGYCLLKLGRPADAVRSLRQSVARGFDSPETQLNLAAAMWQLGSQEKSVRAARRAVALAPGRLDAYLALLHYLTSSSRWTEAQATIEDRRHAGWIDTAETMLMRARASAGVGDLAAAVAALRKARALLTVSGSAQSDAVDGSIIMLDWHRGRMSRKSAVERLGTLFDRNPHSPSLANCYLDAGRTRQVARQVSETFREADRSDPAQVLGVRTRIAYLRCDYPETLSLSQRWSEVDPAAEVPWSLRLIVLGAAGEGWVAAADLAQHCLRRMSLSDGLRNQVAYVLAMAGRGGPALQVIDKIPQKDHMAMATRGLALLASGEVTAGLAAYREAFAAIPRSSDWAEDSALMVLHQAQGLRQLVPSWSEDPRVAVAALPEVQLPADWRDRTGFVLLQIAAERRGWSWPTFV